MLWTYEHILQFWLKDLCKLIVLNVIIFVFVVTIAVILVCWRNNHGSVSFINTAFEGLQLVRRCCPYSSILGK